MIFTIKQYSTLPIIKMKLIYDGRSDYDQFYDKLENAAITFAMRDVTNGTYQVANEEGELLLKDGCDEMGRKEYYLTYTFTADDTDTPGIYAGEFKLFFLDDNSQLIVPIAEDLEIHIIDSFVKSTLLGS